MLRAKEVLWSEVVILFISEQSKASFDQHWPCYVASTHRCKRDLPSDPPVRTKVPDA